MPCKPRTLAGWLPAACALRGTLIPGITITENTLLAQAWAGAEHEAENITTTGMVLPTSICPFVMWSNLPVEKWLGVGEGEKRNFGVWAWGEGAVSDAEALVGGAGEPFPTRALCIKIIKLRESRVRMNSFK